MADMWADCGDDLRRWARAFLNPVDPVDVDLGEQLLLLSAYVDQRGPTPDCDCDQSGMKDPQTHASDCAWRNRVK